MTPLESLLAEVRAAEAKATKGPWALDQMGMFIFGPDMEMIASEGIIGAEYGNVIIRGVGRGLPMASNAKFIAKSRTYVPTMARVIEVLMEERKPFPHKGGCATYRSDFPHDCNCGYKTLDERIAAALAGSEGGGE